MIGTWGYRNQSVTEEVLCVMRVMTVNAIYMVSKFLQS